MARTYSTGGGATNTVSATLPMLTLIGATTILPRIKRVAISFDFAPAVSAFTFRMQRCTTTGTPGTALTPRSLFAPNSIGPVSLCSSGLAIFTVAPTLAALEFLLTLGSYQEANGIEWVALDQDSELVIPNVANNGLALMSLVAGGAGVGNGNYEFHYSE